MSNLDYVSFLVRLWRQRPNPAGPDNSPGLSPRPAKEPAPAQRAARSRGMSLPKGAYHEWLAQIEHIPDGEKQYFASLEELFAFISTQLPGEGIAASTGARWQPAIPER